MGSDMGAKIGSATSGRASAEGATAGSTFALGAGALRVSLMSGVGGWERGEDDAA